MKDKPNIKMLCCGAALLWLVTTCLTTHAQHREGMSHGKARDVSAPSKPLAVESNESTKEQLQHARDEGDATGRALDWLLTKTPSAHGETRAGEYQIAYTVTAPEGWYELTGAGLAWRDATNSDAHLRVLVRDGTDGRVVPDLNVRATLADASGRTIESKQLPHGWYPLMDAYGDNIRLGQSGAYILRVEIAPFPDRRHDPYNGDRFTKPTTAEFANVSIDAATLAAQTPATVVESGAEAQGLAKGIGAAYARTVQAMYAQANDGRDKPVGDYAVVFAVEYAEAYWRYNDKGKFLYTLAYEYSAETNAHVEVAVRDALTGRFMPELKVTASLYDGSGKSLGTMDEPFMWHPWLYHYGENWRVARSGVYRLHVRFEPPAYRRYGRELGKRFGAPVETDFDNIKIKTGQK